MWRAPIKYSLNVLMNDYMDKLKNILLKATNQSYWNLSPGWKYLSSHCPPGVEVFSWILIFACIQNCVVGLEHLER